MRVKKIYMKCNELLYSLKGVALLLYSADNRLSDFRQDAQALNNVRCLDLPKSMRSTEWRTYI